MLNGIMLSVVILSNVLPSVTEPSVVVLNVVAPLRHSKVLSIVTFNFEFYSVTIIFIGHFSTLTSEVEFKKHLTIILRLKANLKSSDYS